MVNLENHRKNYKGVKAYLIARVSDESQRQALPAQELRLKNYNTALSLDGTLYKFDETAYDEKKRKQFSDIVYNKICKEKNFCIVVFDKIDRLTRECSSDLARVLKKLVKEGKIELHFPSDGLVFTKDSPAMDKTRLDMGMVFGGYYSAATSDNVKRRQQQKIIDGEYPSKVPFGYLNINTNKRDRHGDAVTAVITDPERSVYVQRAFELRLEGLSTRSIARILNEEGANSNTKHHKPLSASYVDTMLKNKFYIGIMKWNGVEYPHKYEHLVSDSTFYAVQKLNDEKSHKKAQTERKKTYTYSGVARCAECGGAMSSYEKKGHVYLRCSKNDNSNVSEEILNEQIVKVLENIQISLDTLKKTSAVINSRNKDQSHRLTSQKKLVRQEADRLKSNLEVAYEDRLNGSITIDYYNEIRTKKEERLKELEATLVMLEEQDEDVEVNASYLLELAHRLPELFKSSRAELKNEILKIIFSNFKIQQKMVLPSLLEPFASLASDSKCQTWLPGLDSNQQPRS